MKLFLTKGMFGEHIKQIGNDSENVKTILEHIFAWKNNDENQKLYKVEKYDRLIFNDTDGKIAIDFGDYMTFMLIEGISADKMKQFTNI